LIRHALPVEKVDHHLAADASLRAKIGRTLQYAAQRRRDGVHILERDSVAGRRRKRR
jgi:hypothetical protein